MTTDITSLDFINKYFDDDEKSTVLSLSDRFSDLIGIDITWLDTYDLLMKKTIYKNDLMIYMDDACNLIWVK